jgi:RNA polymerase sigma-70 factor (ECF subfamily)
MISLDGGDCPGSGIESEGGEYHMSKALKELRVALKDYLPLLAWLGWLEEL